MQTQYELNYIEGGAGAQRVVGDHIAEIDDFELVLISRSNLEHAWFNPQMKANEIHEITIHFDSDLFEQWFVAKKQFASIIQMFALGRLGLLFSKQTILSVRHILLKIVESKGDFDTILLFLDLLNQLSKDEHSKVLSNSLFANKEPIYDGAIMQKIITYLSQNYHQQIKWAEMASMVNMSEASFCRFIKRRTGKSFVEGLNDVKISASMRALVDDTDSSIAEIAYRCGFNNLSNFNRIFK